MTSENLLPVVDYPANLNIDYPEQSRNRVSIFFRIFAAIPIIILISLITRITVFRDQSSQHSAHVFVVGVVFLPVILMLLFRRKYPRWWFDWNFGLMAFGLRIASYVFLLRDEYPSTDEEQAVHVSLTYPNAAELSRWLPLVKWFLAIPHYFILYFLFIAAMVCVVIGWFAILFTGHLPRGLFDFIVGVFRWQFRVIAYAVLLTTDRYPPFQLSE